MAITLLILIAQRYGCGFWDLSRNLQWFLIFRTSKVKECVYFIILKICPESSEYENNESVALIYPNAAVIYTTFKCTLLLKAMCAQTSKPNSMWPYPSLCMCPCHSLMFSKIWCVNYTQHWGSLRARWTSLLLEIKWKIALWFTLPASFTPGSRLNSKVADDFIPNM